MYGSGKSLYFKVSNRKARLNRCDWMPWRLPSSGGDSFIRGDVTSLRWTLVSPLVWFYIRSRCKRHQTLKGRQTFMEVFLIFTTILGLQGFAFFEGSGWLINGPWPWRRSNSWKNAWGKPRSRARHKHTHIIFWQPAYLCSASPASAASQTGPGWWYNIRRCPACGSCSVWRCRPSSHPSPGWTASRHLQTTTFTNTELPGSSPLLNKQPNKHSSTLIRGWLGEFKSPLWSILKGCTSIK